MMADLLFRSWSSHQCLQGFGRTGVRVSDVAKKTTGKKSSNRKAPGKTTASRAGSRSKGVTKPKTTPAIKAQKPHTPGKPVRKVQSFTIKTPPRPGKPQPQGKPAATAPKTKAQLAAEEAKKKGRSVAEAASEVKADAKGYVFINGRRVRMISTKGVPPSKRLRDNGALSSTDTQADISVKSIKTTLGRKELTHYRDLLLLKRRELVGDLDAMETQALRSGGGNLSHMPIHMADIGTDTYDQDFMLGLAETERRQLREIDEALQRIEDRTYGVCQLTGEQIPKTRLDAKPWAKYTVEAARKMEGQWGR
jgi:DnaK suppressor protein